jgi:hypothetical protein
MRLQPRYETACSPRGCPGCSPGLGERPACERGALSLPMRGCREQRLPDCARHVRARWPEIAGSATVGEDAQSRARSGPCLRYPCPPVSSACRQPLRARSQRSNCRLHSATVARLHAARRHRQSGRENGRQATRRQRRRRHIGRRLWHVHRGPDVVHGVLGPRCSRRGCARSSPPASPRDGAVRTERAVAENPRRYRPRPPRPCLSGARSRMLCDRARASPAAASSRRLIRPWRASGEARRPWRHVPRPGQFPVRPKPAARRRDRLLRSRPPGTAAADTADPRPARGFAAASYPPAPPTRCWADGDSPARVTSSISP